MIARPPGQASLLLALLCATLAVTSSSCARRPELAIYGTVPDFTLTAQDGSTFRASERLAGKLWIADFIFTHCTGPCPMMSSRMRRLSQDLAGRGDVRFVSITIDPERDTPQELAEYAKHFEADTSRWSFLTGSRETLQLLNHKAFMLGDVDASLEHSTRFVLVDRHSRIRGYYDSTDPASIRQLVDDLSRVAG